MSTNIPSMKKSDPPIMVDQLFDAAIDRIWDAITQRDQMIQWFFKEIPEFKPEVGFKTEFNVNVEGRDFLHLWEVTDVVAKERITYEWRFGGYEGEALSTFELFEQENKTRLKLSFVTTKDFPDGIPEFARESGVQGWSYFIQESLREYMNNNS